jgi:accessory gene regulator protein AgrB
MTTNMNSHPNQLETKEIYADLKSEYIFIFIPFILLILVKLYFGSARDIILASDWSLASCIILGQNAAKISRAVANSKVRSNQSNFGLYMAKSFLCVVISLFFYFAMIYKPSMTIGYIQLFIFMLASYLHFRDGFAYNLLLRSIKDR